MEEPIGNWKWKKRSVRRQGMLSTKKTNKSLRLENVSFQLSAPSQTELIMPCGVTGGLPKAVKLQRASVNRFNFQTKSDLTPNEHFSLYSSPNNKLLKKVSALTSNNPQLWDLHLHKASLALSLQPESQSSWDSGGLGVYSELCVFWKKEGKLCVLTYEED